MSPQGSGGSSGSGGGSTGRLMPNLDQSSTKVLNLTVLQRIDPFIEEILITAAHVTLYEFNIELNQWSRKDVEGSLFVVKRNTQPRFQFIVMNRRNTENLIEDLLGDFEYEVQVPYLLYRNAAQEVNGIWFYNSHECETVANLFSRILNAFSKVPPKHNVSSSKSVCSLDPFLGKESRKKATTVLKVKGLPVPSCSSVVKVLKQWTRKMSASQFTIVLAVAREGDALGSTLTAIPQGGVPSLTGVAAMWVPSASQDGGSSGAPLEEAIGVILAIGEVGTELAGLLGGEFSSAEFP